MSVSQDVLGYVASLTTRAHAVLFYDSKQTAAQIFAAYINGGLRSHETTHFIAPSRNVYETFLQLGGVSVTMLERDGYLNYTSTRGLYFGSEGSIAKESSRSPDLSRFSPPDKR